MTAVLNDRSAIIVAARRTPIGRVGGMLRHFRVEDLAAPVFTAVLRDAGLPSAEVDDVILGNAAGPGGNPARLSALAAEFPVAVPGLTVDRQCGSGLEAVNLAARLIESGAGEVYLAGGVESCSTAPLRAEPGIDGAPAKPYVRARFSPEAVGDPDMGEAAENVARASKISRSRQDAYALRSHRKAVAAQDSGRFDAEIVPLSEGGSEIRRDECPRRDTSAEALAALPPVFAAGGTVTAGNACPVNDGAAAVAVVSHRRFKQLRLKQGLWVANSAAAGVDPNLLGLGPVPSVRKLFAREDLTMADIDVVEFNEAFACQVLACLDQLGVMEEQVNLGGGAIALGHPFGASGAVLMVRLFTELVRRNEGAAGLATLGIGGGMGVATLVRDISA